MSVLINKKDSERLMDTKVNISDFENFKITMSDDLLPKNRGYRLENGDIFTINGVVIEYELNGTDSVFHELEEKYLYCHHTKMSVPCRFRTGKIFTTKELENLANEKI